MGVGRYELSDVQWSRIEGLLPDRVETVGRTATDNLINGVLWVLRSGAHWHDLPERYGKYKSVHKRFSRWAASGVWDKVFRDLVVDRKNLYLMIDSTIVRAPPAGGDGPQKGGRGQGSGALPRRPDNEDPSAGQRNGPARGLSGTGGQVNDCTQAIELLGERYAEWVLADEGYDSQAILDHIEKELYRKRDRIERFRPESHPNPGSAHRSGHSTLTNPGEIYLFSSQPQ